MPLEAPVPMQFATELREHGLVQRLLSRQAFWVTVALLVMCAVMSVLQPDAFASTENFYNITRNFAFIGIMALGMTTVIITGGIDLSVGSVMGLAAIVAGLVLQDENPWWLAISAGLATGLAAGTVNGVLIAWLGLPPFVVTLGTLSIGRSLAVVLSQNKMIYDFGPDADTIFAIGGGQILGIANPVWVLLVLIVVFSAVLHLTRWGRHLYAIGGNEQAALLTGVPVVRVKLAAYIISATTAALAAVLIIGWQGSAINALGTGYELRVIASTVIGGANLMGGEEQVQVVNDLIARRVDGIAVSPSNAPAMGRALSAANKAGIPVLTWDSDLLDRDKKERIAYVGTHNYDIGVNLAKQVLAIKPKGGTICIQSGGAAAANHNERMQGIRDTLSGKPSKLAPGDRLTGQNGWKEVDGCPLYTNDDFPVAVQQMEDILGKYTQLDAFVPTGGFPQFLPQAYRKVVEKYKQRIDDGSLALVVADTLPVQLDLLKAGLSRAQVGQRPFEMGYKVMYFFKDMKDGKAKPKDPTYTGLDVCTPQNVATCVGG
jgi:ribose transport system substrate-binding protein